LSTHYSASTDRLQQMVPVMCFAL